MRTNLQIDPGAVQAVNEFKAEAKQIMAEIDKMIADSDPNITPACVDWKDCSCVRVGLVLTGKDIWWEALLTTPQNQKRKPLADYIYPRLSDRRGTAVVLGWE